MIEADKSLFTALHLPEISSDDSPGIHHLTAE